MIHQKMKDPALGKNLMPKFALFIAVELEPVLIAPRPNYHDHLLVISSQARAASHLHIPGEARDVREVEDVDLLQPAVVERGDSISVK
jgi:hypothetical protein